MCKWVYLVIYSGLFYLVDQSGSHRECLVTFLSDEEDSLVPLLAKELDRVRRLLFSGRDLDFLDINFPLLFLFLAFFFAELLSSSAEVLLSDSSSVSGIYSSSLSSELDRYSPSNFLLSCE